MKTLFLFISFFFSTVYAQKATFKEIKLKPNPKYYDTKEATIVYPIIITANPKADKLMNAQIKLEMLDAANEKQTARAALLESINENGLINLYYEVTYDKNAILSLSVFSEGCGAYCSSRNTYFNFDLKTGKEILITDLIVDEKLDSFRNIVFNEKVKALNVYKAEELNLMQQAAIDSAIYDWAVEQVDNNCINAVDIGNFSISGSEIEIFDLCEFPHMIRSQEPSYKLKYAYKFLQAFLKPKFKKILFK